MGSSETQQLNAKVERYAFAASKRKNRVDKLREACQRHGALAPDFLSVREMIEFLLLKDMEMFVIKASEFNAAEWLEHLIERNPDRRFTLDEMVTDHAISTASNINNDGTRSQLDYLLDGGFRLDDVLDAVEGVTGCI